MMNIFKNNKLSKDINIKDIEEYASYLNKILITMKNIRNNIDFEIDLTILKDTEKSLNKKIEYYENRAEILDDIIINMEKDNFNLDEIILKTTIEILKEKY